MNKILPVLGTFAYLLLTLVPPAAAETIHLAEPLTIIVMDPLAGPLACDCVQGYAQRKYERLAAYLENRMHRRVDIFWAESLQEAIEQKSDGKADLIIGKHSVVKAHSKHAGLSVSEVARLAARDGSTTQHGLIVVRTDDPAKSVADLKGYRIFFGPADCDEKSAAPIELLKEHGIAVPEAPETFSACSEAAIELLDMDEDIRAAAVISSYAEPLLQGCGTIGPGELRVVGQSKKVPFISAFLNNSLPQATQQELTRLLLKVGENAALLIALESRNGFQAVPSQQQSAWPCWRGIRRDAVVPSLPAQLPKSREFSWEVQLAGDGIGGIAAAEGVVVVGGRDLADIHDVFQCIDQESGQEKWRLAYPARGNLDYGNAPRATPVISADRVFLQGAFGHLHCVDLNTGRLKWSKHFVRDFQSARMTWGHCGSPLLVPRPEGEDLLIIQPGGRHTAVVALDSTTGDTVWQSDGQKAGYGSFTLSEVNGRPQLIGFDDNTLGGWDAWSGNRLWTIHPQIRGDFNVQTPIVSGDLIVVSTETNGTRSYKFRKDGTPANSPTDQYEDLCPDSHTPVVVNGHVYGIADSLYCLSLEGLREQWIAEDDAFYVYASLIAGQERLLMMSLECELLLLAANPKKYEVLSRLKLAEEGTETYSHPALVGSQLFARIGQRLVCLDLQS